MDFDRVLIIKLSSLGDVLHTLPFVAAIRQKFPAAKITWVVQPPFADLIPGPPYVDEVIRFRRPSLGHPWRSLADLWRLRRRLRAERFDLSVDLQGLFKSALIAWLSGARKRIGTALMREGSSLVSRRIAGPNAGGHAAQRSLDVARYLGAEIEKPVYSFPDLAEATETVREKLTAAGIIGGASYLVFVPGTRWKTKCWPTDYYAELASRFLADGENVVLAGGPGEENLGKEVTAAMDSSPSKGERGRFVNLIGKTSLSELAALIKNARLYVSGDTGPLHIAAAAGVPLVTMFGPTLPGRTGPFGNDRATVFVTPVDCGGCLRRECPRFRCMAAIRPEEVYSVGRQKLDDENG